MHSASLYCPDGHEPIAEIKVTDDAVVEIRMPDGYVLFSKTLQELGHEILHDLYPVTRTHAGILSR